MAFDINKQTTKADWNRLVNEMDAPQYDERHGGPYDRGSADSYYRRGPDPHYYVGDTMASPKVTDLTPQELEAYMAGYNDNERDNNHKD